ncbi:hypothetical protein COCC4DRAFT_184663 [Bipolaris maydis ATCC 48331]|uniref:Tetraspanin Tsp3 n=2 Tax=Cochliobolus heterostrophus TaxID=5016 RepID=M2UCI8_COCH5|nr:uncharacterized protein COCC4DRAFT_184663 [Bipolaris maydis ATCC 48331]EMD96279.1 hypothetical protein COCHEDRAFT_1127953 [Bipolaris maydis C5]KAJ5030936.1 hypothetical protein J3E73DRAFT_420958 [Bipolaris maydis]ENI11138.1 hypothetical protein COCC4DRAFT_184663 [Bipolaris maydis ATCC 48331]KAJ5065959.1 hypothetical protein J3E74DRAFT_4883 [Bipolaris maydis]KAJ6201156.1 hypothetical protein J3E72DRAFT_31869 [Bipolaris maydis]
MTYTKKQIVTCLSVLYLVIATALAGYAASRANARSVPIAETLTGFTTAFPIVSGLLLQLAYDLTRRRERRQRLGRGDIQRPPLVIIANTLIFIYSTVIITLSGTHVAPASNLNCGLRERWQTLFRHKDATAIRQIQDAFSCCGLANSRDMAWPFPDRTHDSRACEATYHGRASGCLVAWKAEEQKIAGLLMTVVGMVFLWQFAIIAIPTQKDSWLHKVVPDRLSRVLAGEEGGDADSRRAIDYVPGYNRYSDRIEEEAEDDDQQTPGRAIEDSIRHTDHVFPAQIGRDRQPSVENEWSRGA